MKSNIIQIGEKSYAVEEYLANEMLEDIFEIAKIQIDSVPDQLDWIEEVIINHPPMNDSAEELARTLRLIKELKKVFTTRIRLIKY